MTRNGSFRDVGWSRVSTEGLRWVVLFCFARVTLSLSAKETHLGYVEGDNADSCAFFASLMV